MDLNITCPVNSLGYGLVGVNILKALHEAGNHVAWWPIGPTDTVPGNHGFLKEMKGLSYFFPVNAPSIRIYHQFDLAQHVGNGPKVGFPIFELNQFAEHEKHHLSHQDILFVPSRWAADVVSSNQIDAGVAVVPFGVDRDIFSPKPRKPDKNEPTRFFNIGKWEVRKGHDVLLQAFCDAFTPEDNVRLAMFCYNPCFQDEKQRNAYNYGWENMYFHSPMGDKVWACQGRLPSQEHIAQVMGGMDCGVFPSRGEGWNMEALETLSMGRKLITTACTAHLEYCDTSNSLLIEMGEQEKAVDGQWFKGQGEWYAFGDDQHEQLVEHLRNVHEQVQAEQHSGVNEAGIKTAEKFSWARTAEVIKKELSP